MKNKVSYLCLQATREGQASYAHVHEIIRGLKKRGWVVNLYQPHYATDDRPVGVVGKMLAFFLVQIKLFLSPKPDVLYVRSHTVAFPAMLWARIKQVPVVTEINGPYADALIAYPWLRPIGPLLQAVARYSMRLSRALIVVTPQLGEWVVKEVGHESVHVIPNGANSELFHPDANSPHIIEQPYAVFFGALAGWQGIDTLLAAVKCPEWPEKLKLVVLGDGVERAKVEAGAADDDRIVYLGPVRYKDVPGIVSQSMVGLSPQNNLGGRASTGLFPLKVFETLSCGVPVVVTEFPGQADLVRQHQCGIVIPPDDPKALAEAVCFLFKNQKEREEMGRRGREAVVGHHSWDRMASRTHGVLRQCLGP